MVYLNKKETEKVIRELSKTKDKEIVDVVKKMKSPQKRINYAYDPKEIKLLLRKAFKEKRKIKINYYSLSSDEVTSRVIDIYQLHDDCVVAYCNMRKEERTFVIKRINKATLLSENYFIPKDWKPESIILNK
ncbi:MAG: WYL domain-containing protein [Nanoarchaeota archaeon]